MALEDFLHNQIRSSVIMEDFHPKGVWGPFEHFPKSLSRLPTIWRRKMLTPGILFTGTRTRGGGGRGRIFVGKTVRRSSKASQLWVSFLFDTGSHG